MQKDERLLPLPNAVDLQLNNQDGPVNYSPFYDDDTFQDRRSIREYFLIVYKRLPIILAMTVAVTALVAFYMYSQPSIFEAQSSLIIEQPKPKSTTTTVINFGGDPNYYNTQLRLIRSPEVMREVVLRLGLYRDPNLLNQSSPGLFASLRSLVSKQKTDETQSTLPTLNDAAITETAVNDSALSPEEKERVEFYTGMLLGGLNVEQTPNTNIVTIEHQSSNPELSAKVADAVANVYIEQNVARQMQGQKISYQELTASIEQLRDTIAEQEEARIKFMRDANLPLTDGEKGNTLNAQRLQEMSSKWITAEDDRRKLQALYEAATTAASRGEILSVVGEDRNIENARAQQLRLKAELEKRISDLDDKIQEAENKRSQLLVKYTEEHPEVLTATENVKRLQETRIKVEKEVSEKIKSESANLIKSAEKETLTGLQARLAAAQRRENQLRGLYLNEYSSANVKGQSAIRLTTLSNEIETNRNLLNTYFQRQKEMELAISGSRPDNIQFSSSAQTPETPIGPQRNRNIIIAFLLSLAAGVGLAFLLDYLDDSVKTSDDIGRHLGLPTLALIPHQNIAGKRRKQIAGKNGLSNPASSTALAAIEDNRSAMAEAYRHLRTSLLFSSAGKPPQTILVTSSQPSEGKTTTAINTAVTLAQSGADVVIIDCDLRRPRLHNHFGLENTTGLTNYLSGEKNPENMIKPYPGLPKLKVITSGPIPPNPAELLSSAEMKNLLQYLKGNFNHIIVDSPPAISFTDAAILSTQVDGVVLVAMSGKSSIHLIRRFKQRLSTIGARIYGVVLNGIKPDSFEYGYGYGYAYAYDYYDAPEDDTTPRMEEMEEEVTAQAAKK